MTQRFILDENVVICAQLGQNDRGGRDLTCAELITQIIRICYPIVLDYDLRERHLRQLNRPRHQLPQIGPILVRTLVAAYQRADKAEIRPNAETFDEEVDIPSHSQSDVTLVRLAVESGATLVTYDDRLRDDLNSCGVQEAYNLQILSPGEALGHL